MPRSPVLLAFVIVLSACSTIGAQKEREAKALAQLKAELHYTRVRHPAFEPYAQPTLRYLAIYPDLSVEAAYCAVSQESSDDCQDALKTITPEALPKIPKGAIKVLVEQTKDTYAPLLDEKTGLPIFESDGTDYTAFGPVGSKAPQQKKQQLGGIKPMGPIKADAYGPGVHSDATGRSFTYRTRDGQQTHGPVQQDGYGLGVHMDQYGRPVYAVPK